MALYSAERAAALCRWKLAVGSKRCLANSLPDQLAQHTVHAYEHEYKHGYEHECVFDDTAVLEYDPYKLPLAW